MMRGLPAIRLGTVGLALSMRGFPSVGRYRVDLVIVGGNFTG
jgi:hypothetical protein